MSKTEALKYLEAKESSFLQWNYIAQLLVMYGAVVILLFLKGNGANESVIGVKRCDAGDWGLLVTLIVLAILMELFAIYVQKQEYAFKQRVGWEFTIDDFKFDLKTFWKVPLATFLGTVASILGGFAPGFFYIPILMENHLPQEAVI